MSIDNQTVYSKT